MEERQELHCHACNKYVQFTMDMSIDGPHVFDCPNCGHEHCRVVKDGEITADRWDDRNDGYLEQRPIIPTNLTIGDISVDASMIMVRPATRDLWVRNATKTGQ